MSFLRHRLAFLLAASVGMTSVACGNAGTDTSGSGGTAGNGGTGATGTTTSASGGTGGSDTGGSATGGSTTGGQTTTVQNECDPLAPISYETCTGTTFFPEGACQDGSCATIPLETRVFKEWRSQIKAISGLSDAELDERVRISEISHSDGPETVYVGIRYVVVLGWMRARQSLDAPFGNNPLVTPPTDAQVTASVKFSIQEMDWTVLGGISEVVSEAGMQAGFAQCECDMQIKPCDMDFQNVSGILRARAYKVIDGGQNQCKRAQVDLATGALIECIDEPCAIN